MKRIIVSIITAAMLMSFAPASFAAQTANNSAIKLDLLRLLDIVPDEVNNSNIDEKATRRTLAYAVRAIGNVNNYNESDIKVTDVAEDEMSYIYPVLSAGFMKSYGTKFYPNRSVSSTEAREAMINTVSCGADLGPALTSNIRFKSGVNNASAITNRELLQLIQNTLEFDLPKINYNNIGISGSSAPVVDLRDKSSVLAERFDVSVYEGVMNSCDAVNCVSNITITKNVNPDNPLLLDLNRDYNFSSEKSVNIQYFEHAPVKIWVQDETIIYIELQRNITIVNDYVYSVNNDASKDSTIAAPYMNSFYFVDDKKKYGIDDDFILKYNGRITDEPARIVGNFTKTILKESKAIFMEAWDLNEGGIITEYKNNQIKYTAGSYNNLRINDIDKFNSIVLFSAGRSTEISELKPNTYFDYYADENEDFLVIVANEKVITGTLDSVGSDFVTISGNNYYKADTIYYSKDAFSFETAFDKSLYLKKVDAYFTYDGYVKYICPSLGGKVENNDFLAAVIDYKDRSIGDSDKNEILLYMLEGGFEKKNFEISDNVVYKDGLTTDIIVYNELDNLGEGVYSFKLNSRGEISEIAVAQELTGFPAVTLSQGNSPSADLGTPYFMAQAVGTRPDGTETTYNSVLYFDNDTRYVMCKRDGNSFKAEEVLWPSIARHRAVNGGVRMRFFAEGENNAKLRMVLLMGNIVNFEANIRDSGIVIAKRTVVNKYDEEVCDQITVIGSVGTASYYLPPDDEHDVDVNTFIEFSSDTALSDGYINVWSANDVTGDMSTWDFDLTRVTGLFTERIVNIDGQIIFFENGNAATFHKAEGYVILDHGSDKGEDRFELTNKDNIILGNRCVYTIADSIRALIVETGE